MIPMERILMSIFDTEMLNWYFSKNLVMKRNVIGAGVGLIIVTVIIFAATNSNFQNEDNSTTKESNTIPIDANYKPKETNYLDAIKLVQNFKGTDESGSTVTETIVLIIRTAYGSERIFDNPSTKFTWDGLRSFTTPGNIYDVYVDFKAYDGSKEFHFIVDMDDKTIWAGDELTSVILDVVESES